MSFQWAAFSLQLEWIRRKTTFLYLTGGLVPTAERSCLRNLQGSSSER